MDNRFAFDPQTLAPQVRPAAATDIEGMARVSIDTWRLTYNGILPSGYLGRMRLTAHESQRRRLMSSPDTAHFVAAEPVTGETVAFASAGPSRGSAFGASGEIYELYVQNGFQRQGLGRGLAEAARRWLAARGDHAMVIWVLADNPARGFYERLGGSAAGLRTIRVGGVLVDEAAYIWRDLNRPNPPRPVQ